MASILRKRFGRRQRGYVLITSLIFLLVLTLIAVVVTKNTSLNLKMSRNYIEKTAAFEGSEVARLDTDNMLDAFVFSRGWLAPWGSVAATDFGAWGCPTGTVTGPHCTMDVLSPTSTLSNLVVADPVTNPPWDLMSSNYVSTGSSPYAGTFQSFAPTVRFLFDGSGNGSYSDFNDITAVVSIFRLGVYNNPGSGTAMIAGYEGTGKGAAGAGASILFYVKSMEMNGGISATPTGSVAFTGADYRDTIRN